MFYFIKGSSSTTENARIKQNCHVSPQLFSSEEKRASQQQRVTVYGAPGPEPFTVFCVTEQTTARQLLETVSTSAIKTSVHFLEIFL